MEHVQKPLQYEGKAKTMSALSDQTMAMHFKNDATAFNGQKHAQFEGKGKLNSLITELLLEYLSQHGVPCHYIKRIDDRTLLVKRAEMFLLEAVVRFRVAGSLQKRTGLPYNTVCSPPVVEFYYKNDALGDPLFNNAHIQMMGLATQEELEEIERISCKVAGLLGRLCDVVGLSLVDMKFELGRTEEGIVLADEISPDTCRFRDAATGRMLDKDLFRQDAGDLIAGYEEVYSRLQQAVQRIDRE